MSLPEGKDWLVQGKVGVADFSPLVNFIESLSLAVRTKIAAIRSKKSSMSIADMFDLQMAMNKLSQFSEMSTSLIAALNQSSNSISRNVKG
jgi:hypothetical protein